MPSSIHLSVCLSFFLQLLMQQPEQKQSYLCDNPPPPLGQLMHLLVLCITPSPLPRPQPLFLFQSFTKNLFSSYIFSSSHLYQHHMAQGIMWSPQWLLPGRRKEKCVSKPIFERSGISPTLLWSTPHFWYDLDVASKYERCSTAVSKSIRVLHNSLLCRTKVWNLDKGATSRSHSLQRVHHVHQLSSLLQQEQIVCLCSWSWDQWMMS